MEHLIKQLKRLRADEQFNREAVEYCQAELAATPEFVRLQECRNKLAIIQDNLKQVDEQLRELALLEYATTGNKKVADGVSVVINKVLKYSVDRAIGWAKQNAPGMLRLDTKNFEKHAKAVIETMPLDFVEVSEHPSVRIANEHFVSDECSVGWKEKNEL